MNKLTLLIILMTLGISGILFGREKSVPKNLVIKTVFVKNRDVWGTYWQKSEDLLLNGKMIQENRQQTFFTNLGFEKGKLVLIRPLQNDITTEFQTTFFKYKKRKGKYHIDIKDKSESLKRYFLSQRSEITKDQLDSFQFESAICQKISGKFECKFNGIIKE